MCYTNKSEQNDLNNVSTNCILCTFSLCMHDGIVKKRDEEKDNCMKIIYAITKHTRERIELVYMTRKE